MVFAALLVPAGRLADLLGRRRLFTIGVLAFVAASALCGAAPSVGVLIAARVAQAAGAAVLIPASLALLLPAFPLEQRATAVGLWGAAGAASAAIGPSLGAVLIQAFGWRSVFYVNVPLGLLAAVAGARVLTESRDPEHGAIPDVLGIALAAGALGLLALGIVQGNDWAGAAVASSHRWWRPLRSVPCLSGAPAATPPRSWNCRFFACTHSPSRTPGRFSSPPPSTHWRCAT